MLKSANVSRFEGKGMVSRAEATQDFIRRAFCNVATTPGNLAALALLSGNPATGAAIIGAGSIGAAALCNQPPPTQGAAPPFSGGQCPIRYRYSWAGTFTQNGQTFPQSNESSCAVGGSTMFGPISNLGQRVVNNLKGVYVSGFTSTGQPQEFPVTPSLLPASANATWQTTSFQVFPCSGTDNCGNLPNTPIVPPPNYNVYNDGPITYTDDDGNPQEFNPTFTLGIPIFNINGELSFPFTLQIDEPALNLNFEINGEYNVTNGDINYPISNPRQPGGGGGCDEPPLVTPDPVPPDPVPPPVSPEPEPPTPDEEPEKVIIAVVVTVTSEIPRAVSAVFQVQNPDLLIPDVGTINFLYQVSGTTTAWSEDIKIRNARQLVPVPWERGAIAVYGTPRPGITWTITPFYEFRPLAPAPLG